MLSLISDLPANVVGIQVSGTVDAKDYETIIMPAVEQALSQFDKVNILYLLNDDDTHFTMGAMWDDLILGVSHFHHWGKIALVTDMEWIKKAISMFSFTMSCELKLFSNRQLAEATAWVTQIE